MIEVNEGDQAPLLQRYVEERSESALAELIRHHIDLVYSAALRRAAGDTGIAEDITQKVFCDFAAKARSLPPGVVLAGWLYRHTGFVAANMIRSEARRRRREQEYARMKSLHDDTTTDWSSIASVLEEAMEALDDRDRDALLLRFFQQQPLRNVGAALGISEDAARMRVDRALERLRDLLDQRGVTSTAAALAGLVTANAVSICPVGIVGSVSAGALSAAATANSTLNLLGAMALSKTQAIVAAGLVTVGVAIPIWQHQLNRRLQAENQALRAEASQLAEVRGENQRLAEQLRGVEQARDRGQAEVARLRGLVANLRRVEAENSQLKARLEKTVAAAAPAPVPAAASEEEQYSPEARVGIAKMNFVKYWGLAMMMYAQDHGDVFPATLAEAASYHKLPEKEQASVRDYGLRDDQYDLTYQGPLQGVKDPAKTILLRERDAWQSGSNWVRTYLFVDGHSEVHSGGADGNFAPWEKERLIAPASQ